MSVSLEIQDGNPWYLSTEVWVVPGDDPEGPPGLPIVGSPAYMWARVRNNGTDPVANATVRFYWANPSVGFDRNTANSIGSAFVSLAAAANQDVLCLTPWTPVFVNGGHECILAEAFHSSDPLPAGPAFNVPTDRHIAQRNLQVVVAARRSFHLTFEVHNALRQERAFSISAERGSLEQLKHLTPLLGRGFKLPSHEGELENVRFVASPSPQQGELENAHPYIERLRLAPFRRTGFTLVGQLKGEAALVHVVQKSENQIVGGLAVLVLKGEQKS